MKMNERGKSKFLSMMKKMKNNFTFVILNLISEFLEYKFFIKMRGKHILNVIFYENTSKINQLNCSE